MPHSLKSKIKSLCYKGEISEKEQDRIIQALEQQPIEDYISRKEALRHRHIIYDDDGVGYSVVRVDEIEQLPSVTPKPCEEENPNCTECRYYDKEKHHCPRFCRVIENTVAEITSEQTRWIPVSERLPEEETDVLICNENGDIEITSGSYSTELENYFMWYTSGWRFGEVIAWMPLPTSYQGEENG